MLITVAEHLTEYYTGFNVFSYLTTRAILSALTALVLSFAFGPSLIQQAHASANRPADPRRRTREPSAEGRHADDGRRADPARDRDQHGALGESREPLRLDLL